MTRALKRLVKPIVAFTRLEASGGLLLMASAALALIWSNSPLSASYASLWRTPLSLEIGSFALSKPLLLWINDGLMALFFLLIGLEIKRELVEGALSSLRKAALPLAAALGGMIVPALMYALVAESPEALRGWGIPVATDIAFALGVLLLLGTRAPLPLKIFLTAVAIVDDVGAVLIISMFYTASLEFFALGMAAGLFALAFAANRLGVRSLGFYGLIGVLLWVAVLKSGVHATVAGVALAMIIPMRTSKEDELGEEEDTDEEHEVSPLHRLEHALHPWIVFGVLPVFALANAGVTVGGVSLGPVGQEVMLGVIVGLVVGKPLGILGGIVAGRQDGLEMPDDISWRQLSGLGALSGIGFTMSLFVGGLAFADPALLDAAKSGVLLASAVSAVVGVGLLVMEPRRGSEPLTSVQPESQAV